MKLKKLLGCISAVMVSAVLFTGNVTALGQNNSATLKSNTPASTYVPIEEVDMDALEAYLAEVFTFEDPIAAPSSAKSSASRSSSLLDWYDFAYMYPAASWQNAGWVQTKTMRWTEQGSNQQATRTLTSRIGTLSLYYTTDFFFPSYSSYAGSWNNVYLMPVAPELLFMCADSGYNMAQGYYSTSTCPCCNVSTPAYTSTSSLNMCPSYIVVGFYPNGSFDILDFYTLCNPLIYYGWSTPSISSSLLASYGLQSIY